MKKEELQFADITPYINNIDLVKQTADQIIKDFETFGYEIEFSGNENTAYKELNEQVQSVFSALIDQNYERFFALLYRIDLNEQTVKQLIAENMGKAFLPELTHLVIEREFKKVVIRNYFKRNP